MALRLHGHLLAFLSQRFTLKFREKPTSEFLGVTGIETESSSSYYDFCYFRIALAFLFFMPWNGFLWTNLSSSSKVSYLLFWISSLASNCSFIYVLFLSKFRCSPVWNFSKSLFESCCIFLSFFEAGSKNSLLLYSIFYWVSGSEITNKMS